MLYSTHMKKIQTWKQFANNDLSHSWAHYLMTIAELHESQGYARLSDIASRLKISKGSLSTSLKSLIKKELILEDANKHFSLSKEGQKYANQIKRTDQVFHSFLTDILDINDEQAEIDACKIEHLLSGQSSSKILQLLKALKENPTMLKALKKEISKHKDCTIIGCHNCSKNGECLN